MKALIGNTGFIGGNIQTQTNFNDLYNSKNIESIRGKNYDLIVSAGTSSLRWKANLEPQIDLDAIKKLIDCLNDVMAKHFILISTVDVYPMPIDVNEDTQIDSKKQSPYGKNRYYLEKFIAKHFKNFTFVRLPQTFGKGIKKNFVFDLVYNHALDFTHKDSLFQWYNLKNIWKDISIAKKHNIFIINFAVEPITAKELAFYALGINFSTVTKHPALHYDVRTKYGAIFGSADQYIYHKKQVLDEVKNFILEQKKLQ